jgi:acetate kinase
MGSSLPQASERTRRPFARPWRNAWVGFDFDREANSSGKMLISRAGSRFCYIIPTDEELMIARHTLRVMYAHNAGHA